jgi:hypothetical protein
MSKPSSVCCEGVVATIELPAPATALAFGDERLLVVGTEHGVVALATPERVGLEHPGQVLLPGSWSTHR